MSDAETVDDPSSEPAAPPLPSAFRVSSAPHLAAGRTTRRVMFEVVVAMIPMGVAALWMFRALAVVVPLASLAGCLAAEAVANRMRGRDQRSLTDGSAVVTGLILAFSLPPSLNPYMAFIGGCVAIALAKMVFGGLGQNLFNPAMVGRAFLMICFPVALGVWTEPVTLAVVGGVDATTQATPLGDAKTNAKAKADDERVDLLPVKDLFMGKVSGSLGETSALAALVGGVFLLLRRVAE